MVKKITGGVRKLETRVILLVTVANPGSTEGKRRRVKTLVRLCFPSNKIPLMTTQLLDNGAGCFFQLDLSVCVERATAVWLGKRKGRQVFDF